MTHNQKRERIETRLQEKLNHEINNISFNRMVVYFDSYEFSIHENFTYLYLYHKGVLTALIDLDDVIDLNI